MPISVLWFLDLTGRLEAPPKEEQAQVMTSCYPGEPVNIFSPYQTSFHTLFSNSFPLQDLFFHHFAFYISGARIAWPFTLWPLSPDAAFDCERAVWRHWMVHKAFFSIVWAVNLPQGGYTHLPCLLWLPPLVYRLPLAQGLPGSIKPEVLGARYP